MSMENTIFIRSTKSYSATKRPCSEASDKCRFQSDHKEALLLYYIAIKKQEGFIDEKNLTELVFILDKSGSMRGLKKDTIGGYNSMLERQRCAAGDCNITTVLFDDGYELLHDRAHIGTIGPMTEREYCAGGSTALLDAIGKTVHKIGTLQKNLPDDRRAEKVMFVIITDGEENASRLYSAARVKHMIGRQKERYGWEFIFLGANIDAVGTAAKVGIKADRAVNYISDSKGTELSFHMICKTVTSFRESGKVGCEYLDEIRKDKEERGERK